MKVTKSIRHVLVAVSVIMIALSALSLTPVFAGESNQTVLVDVDVKNVPPEVMTADLDYIMDGAVIPMKDYSFTASVKDDNGFDDIDHYEVIVLQSETVPTLSDILSVTDDGATSKKFIITSDGVVTGNDQATGWQITITKMPASNGDTIMGTIKFGQTATAGDNWYFVVVAVDEDNAVGFRVYGPFTVASTVGIFELVTPVVIITGVNIGENVEVSIPVRMKISTNSPVQIGTYMSDLTGKIYSSIMYIGQDFTAEVQYGNQSHQVTSTENIIGEIPNLYTGEVKLVYKIRFGDVNIPADVYEGKIVIRLYTEG